MYEDIERLNKLAKALKDTGLAKTSSEALRMAESMHQQSHQATPETEEIDLDTKDTAREIVQEGEQLATRIPLEYEQQADEIEHLEEEFEEEKEILQEELEPKYGEELKKEIEFLRNEQNDFLISSITEKIEDIKKAKQENDYDRAKQEMAALKEQLDALRTLKGGKR